MFGALTPALARRLGEQGIVLLGLTAISVGLFGRVLTTNTGLFMGGSLLALVGIAAANIVLPVVIKREFPQRIGSMMGLYSMTAAIGVALPTGTTISIGEMSGIGWRGGLGVWAGVAAIAAVPWLMLRTSHGAAEHGSSSRPTGGLLRNGRALSLTAFFGLQALNAYVLMGWLPAMLTGVAGLSPHAAGLLPALAATVAIPISLAMPRLAARTDDQRPHVIAIVAVGLTGYLGLLLAPQAAPLLWVLLLAALYGAFPLAITLIAVRSRHPDTATTLSGLVQSGGYLIATAGPLGIGALKDLTGDWTAPLLALIAAMILLLLSGLHAARPGTVEDSIPRAWSGAGATSR